MIEALATAAGSEAHSAFPPFAVDTYPSQLFWLAVTFAFLFVVMWVIVSPRIGAVMTARKNRIDGDLAAAAKNKTDAEAAAAAYTSTLDEAKARAHDLSEAARKEFSAEIEKAKAEANEKAKAASAEAEVRIDEMKTEAAGHIAKAAEEAAAAIVGKLIGDKVTAKEAAEAVKASRPNDEP
jgi:F-type H+-transporting ATPase subunit b